MDFQHNHQEQQQQQQQPEQQINAGLARYRSAPSSYFSSFLDANTNANSSSNRAGDYVGDDLENFLHSLMPSNQISSQEHGSSSTNRLPNSISMHRESQHLASMKHEETVIQIQPQHLQKQSYYSPPAGPPQDQQMFSPVVTNTSSMEGSYMHVSSMNLNRVGRDVANSNLIRYNSSPAGLFANVNTANEHGAMRGMGNYGAADNANAESSFSSASRFHGFSSGQQSSVSLPPLPENATKSVGESEKAFRDIQDHRNDGAYITGIRVASWDDPSILSDSFLKGVGESDNQSLSNTVGSDNQDNEVQNGPPTLLSRHLSLPMTSTELLGVETLMQDSGLCKLRAKRGCATHPRSIAERVRRTRISERMRKLQELVPNMEKQTNTADMLDSAVDYIKGLQKQVKALVEKRAKCTCSRNP